MNSVLVYCEGPAEHPHVRSKIVTFQHGPSGWTVGIPMRQLLGRPVPTVVTYEAASGEYGEYRALPLIGSDLEGLPPRTDGMTDALDHLRPQMKCPRCGFNETRRGGNLVPILETLAGASITEISLRGLARRK
jgi:hypothetical protein